MLINHEREKLINAVVYFAKNTRFLGKTKLCKLLYFLDFEHYKETGRSVTGMKYSAWPMGPVPVSLFEEVSAPKADMAAKVKFVEKQTQKGAMLEVKPLGEFDDRHFSKRELQIMSRLVAECRDMFAEDMVEATHLENEPWHQIYVQDRKQQEVIPYELALRKQEAEDMKNLIAESQAFIKHFG